jgi:hypothetical protein
LRIIERRLQEHAKRLFDEVPNKGEFIIPEHFAERVLTYAESSAEEQKRYSQPGARIGGLRSSPVLYLPAEPRTSPRETAIG